MSTDGIAYAQQELLHAVFYRFVVLRSGWEWELPGSAEEFRTGSRLENFAAGMRWMQEKRIDVEDLYTLVSPAEAQTVYQDLQHNRAKRLFSIFKW